LTVQDASRRIGAVGTLSSGPVVVGAEHLQVSFDAAVPAAVEIDPGTVVAFETSDAIFRRLATGEPLGHEELQQANAVTGPVGVRGAEPGDALRIEVLDVEIAAAWIVRMEGFGPLGAGVDGIRVTPARVESGRVFIADGRPWDRTVRAPVAAGGGRGGTALGRRPARRNGPR
jgi:acetamidase/formamidase